MTINDIFKPKHANLLSEICTQLRGATVTHYSIPLTMTTLPKVSSLHLDNKLPTLYYFEIVLPASYSNIFLVDIFNDYRENNKGTKAITAVRHPLPNSLCNSKCLYVGKVRNHISERLAVHLGTGGSVQTAGLRLKDWTISVVSLKLHVYQIEGLSDAFLVDIFEEYLREMHEPVLGIK